jgi:hypothetical protein
MYFFVPPKCVISWRGDGSMFHSISISTLLFDAKGLQAVYYV